MSDYQQWPRRWRRLYETQCVVIGFGATYAILAAIGYGHA
jgi:hypothetical protein